MARTCCGPDLVDQVDHVLRAGLGHGRERRQHRAHHRDPVVRREVAEGVVVGDQLSLAPRDGRDQALVRGVHRPDLGHVAAGVGAVGIGVRRVDRGQPLAQRGRRPLEQGGVVPPVGVAVRLRRVARPQRQPVRRDPHRRPGDGVRHQPVDPAVHPDAGFDDQLGAGQGDCGAGAGLEVVRVDVWLEDAHQVHVLAAHMPHQVLHLGGGRDHGDLSRGRARDVGGGAAQGQQAEGEQREQADAGHGPVSLA